MRRRKEGRRGEQADIPGGAMLVPIPSSCSGAQLPCCTAELCQHHLQQQPSCKPPTHIAPPWDPGLHAQTDGRASC